MKRDLDLIRKILLKLEEHEHGRFTGKMEIEGYTEEQIGYHQYLAINAGLAMGGDTTTMHSPSPSAAVSRLTPEGHDFLDDTRDETVWNETQQSALKVGGTVSLAVAVELAKDLVMRKLGLRQ
jgi:hypothetical protein